MRLTIQNGFPSHVNFLGCWLASFSAWWLGLLGDQTLVMAQNSLKRPSRHACRNSSGRPVEQPSGTGSLGAFMVLSIPNVKESKFLTFFFVQPCPTRALSQHAFTVTLMLPRLGVGKRIERKNGRVYPDPSGLFWWASFPT